MTDKSPTRVRVLADGETKEYSVLLPPGCWGKPDRPERLFVRVEPNGLIFVATACVTSQSETAERLLIQEDRVILRRVDARWLLDVLPAALDHANQGKEQDAAVLHEDRHPLSVLTLARQLARELRDAKQVPEAQLTTFSVAVWTRQACELLSQICDVLGVDRHDGGLER